MYNFVAFSSITDLCVILYLNYIIFNGVGSSTLGLDLQIDTKPTNNSPKRIEYNGLLYTRKWCIFMHINEIYCKMRV
jgi:hypothetical protein